MKNPCRAWYDEFGGPANITKDDFFLKASGVEIFFFYLSILSTVIFCILVAISDVFQWKFIILFFPILFWMLLRSSRKDMHATANWFAAIFGALGGAALIIASKIILK